MKTQVFVVAVCVLVVSSIVSADTFGTGTNQFTIDFVTISGSTNPSSGIPAGYNFTFTGVANNYRIGKFEITNDQWTKFAADYGEVTGNLSSAYDSGPFFTGAEIPTNCVSWYEAAQFVNYLNTRTGHQAAYKFTGTQGTSNYAFTTWAVTDPGYNVTNPYRNSNAFYFLPTENEWVKAAYWNGTSLQTYATKSAASVMQGDGTSGTGWNYYTSNYATNPSGPWAVGCGSQELNGTYDMMGNVYEWIESPYISGDYAPDSSRDFRGGFYGSSANYLTSSERYNFRYAPDVESTGIGFRVASVPEPASVVFLALAGLALLKRTPRLFGK